MAEFGAEEFGIESGPAPGIIRAQQTSWSIVLVDADFAGNAARDLMLDALHPPRRDLCQRADLNGVTFFEKALEICRERRYPLTEANAYLEYGIFRRMLGDHDEARSYVERARQLCAEIGATQLERAAAEQLAQI